MPLATARGVPERSLIASVRGVISLRFTLCAIDRPHGSKRERAVGMQIRDRQHVSLPRWNEYTQSLETAAGQKPPPEVPRHRHVAVARIQRTGHSHLLETVAPG